MTARPPRGLSISARLQLLVGLSVLVAMCTFGGLAYFVERRAAVAALVEDQEALAGLMAERSIAALLFDDELLARDQLAALAAIAHVHSACLFDADGRLFASHPAWLNEAECPPAAPPPGLPSIAAAVPLGDGRQGLLRLASRLDTIEARLLQQVRHGVIIAVLALVLALLLAFWLERRFTGPLRRLVAVAEAVQPSGAAELRATIETRDEVGELAAAFNRMLDRQDEQTRKLRAEAEYNQVLFQRSPLPVVVIDGTRNITIDCNEAATAVYGFQSREETLAAGVESVSTPTQYDGTPSSTAVLRYLRGALAGEPQVYEWRHRRPDGSTFDAEVHLTRFGSPEAPMLLGSLLDITERKAASAALERLNSELESRVALRTRELEVVNAELTTSLVRQRLTMDELVRAERLAALGSLVAGIAHELNTPLGSALLVASTLGDGLAELREQLERGELRRSRLERFLAEQDESLDLLLRNTRRAAELIGQFKQMAMDQTSEQRRRFDLAEVVDEVMASLQPRLRGSPHRIVLELERGLWMDSYPGPLGQVLTNLVINALLHGLGERPGQLTIACRGIDAETVELMVADDGAGIATEHLSRIFDPFFTTRLGHGGSGLGLHIVFVLVQGSLGGRIEVQSQPGQGACFRVRLARVAPLVAPTAPSVAR